MGSAARFRGMAAKISPLPALGRPRLNNLGNGRYQIINRGTGTALDGAGNTAAGSTVTLWAPNTNTNNQWTITAV